MPGTELSERPTQSLTPGRRRWTVIAGDDFDRHRPWLIALACGLFGLSVLMLAVVLIDDGRTADQPPPVIVSPTPAAVADVPAVTTTPSAVRPPSSQPRPVPKPESPAPETSSEQRERPAPDARELVERYMTRVPAGFPGLPSDRGSREED
ncbi:MAG: hypothetical protein ACRDRH_18585 [Pseudonocardia sp.]